MKYATIAIRKELKEKVKEFGTKKETYSDIIERLLKSAMERQFYDILMSEEGTISIDEALETAKKKWQK